LISEETRYLVLFGIWYLVIYQKEAKAPKKSPSSRHSSFPCPPFATATSFAFVLVSAYPWGTPAVHAFRSPHRLSCSIINQNAIGNIERKTTTAKRYKIGFITPKMSAEKGREEEKKKNPPLLRSKYSPDFDLPLPGIVEGNRHDGENNNTTPMSPGS